VEELGFYNPRRGGGSWLTESLLSQLPSGGFCCFYDSEVVEALLTLLLPATTDMEWSGEGGTSQRCHLGKF